MVMSHVEAFLNRSIVGAKLLQIYKCFFLCNIIGLYIQMLKVCISYLARISIFIQIFGIYYLHVKLLQFFSFHNQAIKGHISQIKVCQLFLLIYASSGLLSYLNCTVNFCVYFILCSFVTLFTKIFSMLRNRHHEVKAYILISSCTQGSLF